MNQRFFVILLSFFLISPLFAQQKLDNRAGVVFGVSQIALGGFNVEGIAMYKRFTFDYSHGISLNLNNAGLEAGADKDQGLAFHLPWTTGFGVGYRFNNWLNLRVEPKWHKFDVYYDGEAQTAANLVGDYTTFTLGLGLYGNLVPFKNQDNFLKGFTIVPNVRWWPQVSSSLDNNQFTYDNKLTAQSEVHTAREIGIGNTPFFVNMSVGYVVRF